MKIFAFGGEGQMEGFLVLAAQLFLIVCIQSVLEVAAADRFQNHQIGRAHV